MEHKIVLKGQSDTLLQREPIYVTEMVECITALLW